MTYDDASPSVRSLQQRLRNLEGRDDLAPDVLPTVKRAIAWANALVRRIAAAGT